MIKTIQCKSKNISINLELADGFFARLIGLMFRANIAPDVGFFISRCNWIHTCFMRFPIDLIFIDSDYRVIKVVPNMKSWRLGTPVMAASHVIELSAKNPFCKTLAKGDQLNVGC